MQSLTELPSPPLHTRSLHLIHVLRPPQSYNGTDTGDQVADVEASGAGEVVYVYKPPTRIGGN